MKHLSIQNKLSPKPDDENQSQKNDNGRFGDTDDTLHTNGKGDNKLKNEEKKLLYCSYCDRFKSCQKNTILNMYYMNI